MWIAAISVLFLLISTSTCDELGESKRVKRVSSSVMEDGDFADNENVRSNREAAAEFDFPLSLPPYDKLESATVEKYGSCLLYLESLSVFVFNSEKRDPSSGKAVIDSFGKNKFSFDDSYVSCLNSNSSKREFSFRISVNLEKGVPAKGNDDTTLFTVEGPIDVLLTFNVKKDTVWSLQKATLQSPLTVKRGSWLQEDVTIATNAESVNAKYLNIGAYKNFNYACSGSSIIAWPSADSKGESKVTVGVSLNNIQLQAYDIISGKDSAGKRFVKFSSNVNDCVGTFSVGSWMGIVVVLVLLGVLAFGYLMLNSVQTMDRFDDPKQKQLIINAKD